MTLCLNSSFRFVFFSKKCWKQQRVAKNCSSVLRFGLTSHNKNKTVEKNGFLGGGTKNSERDLKTKLNIFPKK